jgi:hypothetical protein
MACVLRDRNIIIVLVILFVVIIALAKLRIPDLEHGDEFSDASTLMSGKNFIKLGFIPCRFLPIFEPHLNKPSGAYTHAPPLSDIMNGLLRLIFRTDSLRFFRGVALLFSLGNLLLWYIFIKKITNSCVLSFLASIFYFTNPLFIYGADSLYQNSYVDFLRVLIFLVFFMMVHQSAKKQLLLPILWMLVFISSLFTYEYIVYYSLFFALYGYFFKTTVSRKTIVVLLSAPVCGFLLHFLQNAWYFGSILPAYQDLKGIAIERMLYSKDALPLTVSNWFQHVIIRNFLLVFLVNYFVLLLFMFAFYLLYQGASDEIKKRMIPLGKLLFLLCICGISWYIFFPSHSWAHTFLSFLARHLLPVSAIWFTMFTYLAYAFFKVRTRSVICATICSVLIALLISMKGLFDSELPITRQRIKSAQDFAAVKTCLLKIREVSSAQDEIGVNYFRYPFIRYYTDRRCYRIFDVSSLESMPKLPRYFLFLKHDNQRFKDLLEFLNQKYLPLFVCDSLRFPATIFELKTP